MQSPFLGQFSKTSLPLQVQTATRGAPCKDTASGPPCFLRYRDPKTIGFIELYHENHGYKMYTPEVGI